jgi:hypothetical protein
MKKIKFSNLNTTNIDTLSRDQLKNVLGGSGDCQGAGDTCGVALLNCCNGHKCGDNNKCVKV